MINNFLLDERFDDWISECLMTPATKGPWIDEDGNIKVRAGADKYIYQALKLIEERKKVKL